MVYPNILNTKLSTYTLSMSGSENVNYPLVNLKNYLEADQWKGIETIPQYIQIEFPTATPRDYVLIANHNLASIGNSEINSIPSNAHCRRLGAMSNSKAEFEARVCATSGP